MRPRDTMGAMLALALLASPACPGGDPAPDDGPHLAPCGLDDASIPDFSLTDVIPGSATYDRQVALSDFDGMVLLIFWMTAT